MTEEPSTITDSVISRATARGGTPNSTSSADTTSGISASLNCWADTLIDR